MSTAPRDFGLYLHWPYCSRLCPYCDFNIVRHRGGGHTGLLAAILADLHGHKERIEAPGPLASLSFGGGTPSLMTPAQIGAVVEAADQLFGFKATPEISLEANPNTLDANACAGFAAAGINRFSIGVQSLDEAELRFLGRDHDAVAARRSVNSALASGQQVSADFIYDLPGQSVARWQQGLEAALALGLAHYSFYALTIEPGTAFGRQAAKGRLQVPPQEHSWQLFELTRKICEAAGLPAYEVSNHALSDAAQSRHNLLYWRNQDWIGIGPGAHGRAQMAGQRKALVTAKKVSDYCAAVQTNGWGVVENTPLGAADEAMEMLTMGLRLRAGLSLKDLKARTGYAPPQPRLQSLVNEGWLAIRDDTVRVRRQGRALIDHLVLELLG